LYLWPFKKGNKKEYSYFSAYNFETTRCKKPPKKKKKKKKKKNVVHSIIVERNQKE